jgi:hypothetical protein
MRINGAVQRAEFHVESKEGALKLEVDSSSVYAGDSVTFTASAVPEDFAFSVSEWWWDPDGGSLIQPDCAATGTSCRVAVHGSGRMIVIGSVSGKVDTADARVEVRPPDLTLRADSQVVALGSQVAFTAEVLPQGSAFTITHWRWEAEGGAQGQTAACAASENPCTSAVLESGRMWVVGTVGGVPDSASVHIDAINCPWPTDSIWRDTLLNVPAYRDSLLMVLNNSNPNAAHDSLKIEWPYQVLLHPTTGDWKFMQIQPDSANNCTVWFDVPSRSGGYELYALIHPHAYFPGDTVRYCGAVPTLFIV